MPETTLDLRGLRCPLPALKTRKALTRLAAGDLIVVECTDPLSTLDIPNLFNQTGDVLEDTKSEPGLFVFRIRKTGTCCAAETPEETSHDTSLRNPRRLPE